MSFYNETSRGSPSELLLAIVLKGGTVTRKDRTTGEMKTAEVTDGTFAGFCGIISQPERATVDLGLLLVSTFQRTFVGTHTIALLLHACLDSVQDGGLGLRRVQWQANASNTASVSAAERMGFTLEGVIRWQQVLSVDKKGSEGAGIDREGLPRAGWKGQEWGAGRHTAMLSICWDDWVQGVENHVDALVRR